MAIDRSWAFLRILAVTIPTILIGTIAYGQPATWDGGGATNDFTDAFNWVGDVAPTTNGVYTFAGTVGLTPNNNVTLSAADNTLTFDATAGAFTLTGGAIRIGSVTNSSSNLQTLNVSLRLNGTRTVNVGNVGIRLNTLPLSTGSSARNMTKTGAGDLTLGFANTYAFMNYAVSAGRLVVENSSGTFSQGGTTTLAAGTELILSQAGTGDFTGVVSGAGLVRKAGTGPSTLSGLNTYTGGTVVEAGILTTASDFTMSGANGFTMAGVPSPTAGSDYGGIVASAGTLTYGGDLGLTLSGTATPGATYDLFSFSGGTQAGSFSNVVLGGSYTSTLSNSGGVWTGTDAGLNFAFTESTGQFAVSAVPEPVTFGLTGLATAALAAGWMRRRNGRHSA